MPHARIEQDNPAAAAAAAATHTHTACWNAPTWTEGFYWRHALQEVSRETSVAGDFAPATYSRETAEPRSASPSLRAL